jgi:hypothetical protein
MILKGNKHHTQWSKESDWNWWNKRQTFNVYEGVMLQNGILPPRDITKLPDKQFSDVRFLIQEMSDSQIFKYFTDSLCSDKVYGHEWRSKSSDFERAKSKIQKNLFLTHWNKCGFSSNKKFKIKKDGGRPSYASPKEMRDFADTCIRAGKSYEEFLCLAAAEYGYVKDSVRNSMPKKLYRIVTKLPQ